MEQSRTTQHKENPVAREQELEAKQGRGRSYQGRFLDNTPKQPPSGSRRRRKKEKERRRILLLGAGSLLLLLVSIVLMVYSCATSNPIVGYWTLDSRTSYVFYEDGVGKLVLPINNYEFSYTLEDDVVSIDFYDERARDSRYTFEIEGDMMVLVGGYEDSKSTYILTRVTDN